VLTPVHAQGAKEVGRLKFDNEHAFPAWNLAQWSSKYNISTTPLQADEENRIYKYANEGKEVVKAYVDGETVLTLKVIGEAEYQDGPSQNGQAWPPLLIEQS